MSNPEAGENIALPKAVGVLGFSGTQRGLTRGQQEQLAEWLRRLSPIEVHHGDCVGADAQFHELVRKLLPRTKIVIHPPRIEIKRAFCSGDEARPPRAYLTRNRVIVRASEAMLVAPAETEEKLRSGTWATWRFAKKQGRTVLLVLPDLVLPADDPTTNKAR